MEKSKHFPKKGEEAIFYMESRLLLFYLQKEGNKLLKQVNDVNGETEEIRL